MVITIFGNDPYFSADYVSADYAKDPHLPTALQHSPLKQKNTRQQSKGHDTKVHIQLTGTATHQFDRGTGAAGLLNNLPSRLDPLLAPPLESCCKYCGQASHWPEPPQGYP